MDSPRNATTARGEPRTANKPTAKRTVARKRSPWPEAPLVPPEAIGLSGTAYLRAIGELPPEHTMRPYQAKTYHEVYPDEARRSARTRLEVFGSIAREFRALVDGRERAADDAVRSLREIAERADLDLEAALAAVCVAFVGDRPNRGEGTDDMRRVQVECMSGWWWGS